MWFYFVIISQKEQPVSLSKSVKSALVIRCGALGDLIYATSVIDALRSQYGKDIAIDFVVTPGPGTIFKKDSRVRHVFNLTHRKVPNFLSSEKRAIINFSKKKPYDLLLNFENGKQFVPLAEAIKANSKVGNPFTERGSMPAEHAAEQIKRIYMPVISREILDKSFPSLRGSDYSDVKDKYNLPDTYLIFNPSNSHNKRHRFNYRAWPQEHWKTLINAINSKVPIVISGGKGEDDYFDAIKPYPDNVIDLVGKTPLSDLISITKYAKAMITTDTGPAHLASALSTPVYALIGPTDYKATGPYQTPNNEVHIISLNLECAPCYTTPEVMFACTNNHCMNEITPESVLKTLAPILKEF